MTWINELEDIYADGGDWTDMEPIFNRINSLLRRASLETDNEILCEEIEKEICENE